MSTETQAIVAPVFNLNVGNLGYSDEDIQKKLDEGGKAFAPGNYDLQIVGAAFHPNKRTGSIYCDGDQTWLNVVITAASGDGRTTKTWIQVPTVDIKFGPKKTFFVYKKFTEFMASIGVAVTADKNTGNLGKVVPQYFSDPAKALIGAKINVDIGYDGPHATKGTDGMYTIVRAGKPLTINATPALEGEAPAQFPDFASAKAWAGGQSPAIELAYAGILRFKPAILKATEGAKEEW